MAGDPPALKRPKLEKDESANSHRPSSANGTGHRPPSSASTSSASVAPPPDEDMAEEAVRALIAHRERAVAQCNLKLAHYQSQLEISESELAAARARYRDRAAPPSRNPPPPPDRRTPPPAQRVDPKPPPPSTQKAPAPQTRPQLVIPGTNSRPAPRAPAPRLEPVPRLKKAAADAPSSSSQERPKKADKKPKREIVQREPSEPDPEREEVSPNDPQVLRRPPGLEPAQAEAQVS